MFTVILVSRDADAIQVKVEADHAKNRVDDDEVDIVWLEFYDENDKIVGAFDWTGLYGWFETR